MFHSTLPMETTGASVVITNHVLSDRITEYEAWLNEIGPICRRSEGLIDWQIIRPVKDLTFTYTVIIRYDSEANLRKWIESDERKRLIEKARPFLRKGDHFVIHSGLDFLFSPEDDSTTSPVRWKQVLITWSAIFPLVLLIPLLILPALRACGIPPSHYFDNLLVSGVICSLMVYVVMPPYTRLLRKWLYR